jgi:hypothetical protein
MKELAIEVIFQCAKEQYPEKLDQCASPAMD